MTYSEIQLVDLLKVRCVVCSRELMIHIALSHFCDNPGPTTKNTTFADQGRDCQKSVIKGYTVYHIQYI